VIIETIFIVAFATIVAAAFLKSFGLRNERRFSRYLVQRGLNPKRPG
jgi:hypothetical protein